MSRQPPALRQRPRVGDTPRRPLVEELPNALSAWDAAQRLVHLPHFLFLDSADSDSPLSRYSFVTGDPYHVLRHPAPSSLDPFATLDAALVRGAVETLPGLPPFQGGAAGLFGYDLCHHVERLPRPRFDEFRVPELCVGLYDWTLAFDHQERRGWIVSTGMPESDSARRRIKAEQRLREVRELLDTDSRETVFRDEHPLTLSQLCPQHPLPGREAVLSNFTAEEYLSTVRRAIEYVHAGDCFQVNVAQRLLTKRTESPFSLYARLREKNSAPFAAYFDVGNFAVASASPERFLRVEQGYVETRPIKGTRPRGANTLEDEALRRQLLDSPKDRAENVMIVDLLRNDLGRVCTYGSVRVEALCRLESYRHVHHLVSEVSGRLRSDVTAGELLRATFPGGSVTGAPKVRAMEIIAELEPTSRGAYCGCLGYVGFDGGMDLNLLIRTFTIGRGWVQFPVGGGIVADSTSQAEYAETLHKAEGMLRALNSR